MVEVRLSAATDAGLPFDPEGLTLTAETFVDGEWQVEAEDVLR